MYKKFSGFFVLALLVTVTGGVATPAAADTHQADYTQAMKSLNQDKNYGELARSLHESQEETSATRVRSAFLKAKKAFHEARQEIQAIKKGDKTPKEDVPCFFCDESNDEGSDGDQVEEDPHLQT